MSLATSYIILILAVILGVTSNSFAKSAEGFTLLFPSIITAITIVACMYALSMVMKNIPMGITYASFAGLTIIATVIVGIFRFDQIPNLYSIIGLAFIITGVTIVACMYALSMVMKNIPMGITYASFAGLTIIATVVVGIFRFDQMPNLYSIIGLVFIIIGVLMVNLLGNN